MSNTLYYNLANRKRVMPVLMPELMGVMSTPNVEPELRSLEQLPYLVDLITHLYTMPFPSPRHYSHPSIEKRPAPIELKYLFPRPPSPEETLRLCAVLMSRLPPMRRSPSKPCSTKTG